MIDAHSFLAGNLAKLNYNKYNQTYTACCPICREGDSWLKKKRFYFYTKTNSCYCFNCGYSAKLYKLYYDVTGKPATETNFLTQMPEETSVDIVSEILPKDSVNIFDTTQVYKNIKNHYFKQCLEYVTSRRLHSAINRPNGLAGADAFLSMTQSSDSRCRLVCRSLNTLGPISRKSPLGR